MHQLLTTASIWPSKAFIFPFCCVAQTPNWSGNHAFCFTINCPRLLAIIGQRTQSWFDGREYIMSSLTAKHSLQSSIKMTCEFDLQRLPNNGHDRFKWGHLSCFSWLFWLTINFKMSSIVWHENMNHSRVAPHPSSLHTFWKGISQPCSNKRDYGMRTCELMNEARIHALIMHCNGLLTRNWIWYHVARKPGIHKSGPSQR